jgi:hypothetical protein
MPPATSWHRRDPGRSEVEAAAVFEHCTSTAGFRQLGGDYIAGALQKISMKLNLNFVDSTTILFANWPDVKADEV